MKKNFPLMGIIILLLLSSNSIFPQAARGSKSKGRKVTKKSAQPTQTKISDAAFEKKLADTMLEPERWREHTFAKENFKVLLPRSSVKKAESFYDDSVGKVDMQIYTSIGDAGVFVVGKFALPFAITDANALQKFYQGVADGVMSDDEFEVSELKNINLNGKAGLEVISTSRKEKDDKARMRIILLGKNVFYNLASPLSLEAATTEELLKNRTKFNQETVNFFNSLAELPSAVKTSTASVPPLFRSTFADGIYRSEYFDLTVDIPKDWIEVAQTDVDGMRKLGKDILSQNSRIDLSGASNARRNLFTFASKPLGSEKNAAITCNLTKRPSMSATLLELSNIVEQEIRKVAIYTVTKGTYSFILGNTKFVGFETKGRIGGEEFQQMVYFTFGKDYALGLTMVYHNEEQKKTLLESLSSMKFAS